MIINPRVGLWFCVITAAVSGLLLCGTQFTTLFGTLATAKILAGLGIFNVIANGINGILHMIPASAYATPQVAAQFLLGPKTS